MFLLTNSQILLKRDQKYGMIEQEDSNLEETEKQFLIKAIKEAKSPKLALNGAKLLHEGDPSLGDVSRSCFEEAWADATRMNRLIERKQGKVRWPERFDIDDDRIRSEVRQFESSKDKATEWGRILSTYGIDTIKSIRSLINLP